MATQPKPPPKPEPPKPAPKPEQPAHHEAHARRPATPIGAVPEDPDDPQAMKMEAYEDELEDEPARTIADEQRERSAELQDKGVERVKEEGDQRDPEDRRSRPVTGVSHRPIEPHETARR
jgi:hypothetical protein